MGFTASLLAPSPSPEEAQHLPTTASFALMQFLVSRRPAGFSCVALTFRDRELWRQQWWQRQQQQCTQASSSRSSTVPGVGMGVQIWPSAWELAQEADGPDTETTLTHEDEEDDEGSGVPVGLE